MYIAHKKETDGSEQTVEAHCRAVMKLSEKFSSSPKISGITRLAALLHDVGKMNADFTGYIRHELNFKRGDIDHSYAGAKYITELSRDMDGENISDTALFIARIILSHHGLSDWVDRDSRDHLEYRTSKNERYDEICSGIKTLTNDNEIKNMLTAAATEYTEMEKRLKALCDNNSVRYSFYMGLFERLAQSVLVDADCTDTAEFMDGIYCPEFDTAAVWEAAHDRIEGKCEGFRKETDRISVRRMDISDRCARFALSERKICRLIVPTGGGKTLSSMRFAVGYCRRFGKKKIFYIAPFMSILEQNSDVLREIAGDENFLEHHSDIAAKIENDDEFMEYERRCERWSEPVISTTAVQFLNTLFSGKMSSVRRFHSFENSVIIIDEIQSLPIKCVYLFNLAMNFLANVCGAVIVLCSATQPVFEETEYPLLLDDEESMTGDISGDHEEFKRTELVNDMRTEQYTYEQAAEYAYSKFSENGDLLMILNTKKAAAELFRLLKERCGSDVRLIHLSTSMCPAHRKDRLKEVRELLGKRPVICVTTQLIEAGVDISFKCVIRSAAGLESIAQAAGRCNRHGKDNIRPVYVINIKDEKLGSGLEQIKCGRDIFTELAHSGVHDLMSDEAMNIYFKKLYSEYTNGQSGRDELKYYSGDKCLLDLLSKNQEPVKFLDEEKKKQLRYRAQAFRTAGGLFKVIDDNSCDVIVPYNDEAKKIILALNSDIDIREAKTLLRKAQKYSVGLYSSVFDEMFNSEQIHRLYSVNAFALDSSCYDGDVGVCRDGALNDPLIY